VKWQLLIVRPTVGKVSPFSQSIDLCQRLIGRQRWKLSLFAFEIAAASDALEIELSVGDPLQVIVVRSVPPSCGAEATVSVSSKERRLLNEPF
jgi:hypothetical protein